MMDGICRYYSDSERMWLGLDKKSSSELSYPEEQSAVSMSIRLVVPMI